MMLSRKTRVTGLRWSKSYVFEGVEHESDEKNALSRKKVPDVTGYYLLSKP